jgi:uncharacterized hydrophobic protein (TIGR00341 family)
MTLRLAKLLVPADQLDAALEILDEHQATVRWSSSLEDGRAMVDVVLPAAGNEPILDALEEAFRESEGFRILFFPLEATVPRLVRPEEEEEEEEGKKESDTPDTGRVPSALAADAEEEHPSRILARINREELYADLAESSRTTGYYLIMVALSSVVASAGLLLGDGAVIIGAMVIAPLIGPNLAVGLATSLGDLKLGKEALMASINGAVLAFLVALAAGILLTVDPEGSEIFGRTRLTYEHLTLALAAGAAGAISLGQGVGSGLVGVMVAVALLPPLANAGLLLGDGHWEQGMGAMALVAGNVVCVNLAATATFLLQGVRPNTWWEEDVRKKAVRRAFVLWGLLLLALVLVVWFAWGGEPPSLPT